MARRLQVLRRARRWQCQGTDDGDCEDWEVEGLLGGSRRKRPTLDSHYNTQALRRRHESEAQP